MTNNYSDSNLIDMFGRGKSYYEESPDDCFQFPGTYHELREYYRRHLGPSWYVCNKKSAEELLTVENYLLRGIIIQQMAKFYVFVDNPNLSESEIVKRFQGCSAVNEIIPKQRLRYPTIDIDSKTPSLGDLLLYFNTLVDSINDVLVFETNGGYHILLKTIPVDFEGHRSLLNKIATDRPTWNVDKQAGLYSIKLPGTRSAKPGSINKRLIYPVGFTSTLLSCPIETQPYYEKLECVSVEGLHEDGAVDDLSVDQIQQISTALTGQPDQITGVTNQTTNMISLRRVPGGFCNICNRRHGYNEIGGFIEEKAIDAFVCVYSDRFVIGCFRNTKHKIALLRPDDDSFGTDDERILYEKYLKSYHYRRRDYPGEFLARIPDFKYCEAPIHENGNGCKIIYNDDYMDGSPCGTGKSESAWKSIPDDQSILCVSYRKSFTRKTTADYNLESYETIHGGIIFDTGIHRRVISQIESIVRVRGIPDVLLLDEWHGILRQIISSSRGKQIWETLTWLICSAKRVIVLDADANNDDLMLFRTYFNRDMKFIINDYQPDHDKKFIVEQSHHDNYIKLLAALQRGNRAVVFTHNKRHGDYSVESLAKLLQHLGYSVKYYHADTDSAGKQHDFENITTAFEHTDVVIYNHTVEAGISIVDERFKYMAVFSEELGSVEATKQAIHRFRNISEIHYSATKRVHTELPLTRDDIIAAIESHERELSSTELLFRTPNLNDVYSSYGYAFISTIIDENNSKCYFTGRLVEMMKRTGYLVEWELPDEYETWKEKINQKRGQQIDNEAIHNNPAVDDFLKSSIGERIAAADVNMKTVADAIKTILRNNYHRYDPDERLEPYAKKLKYLNHVFQTEISKIDHDQIEYLDKNVTKLRKYNRIAVDHLNEENAVISQPCRSDKITPRQQIEMVRGVLETLNLPDVVSDRLDVASVQVNRGELVENISKMLKEPERLEKYNTMMKYFNEIFPDVRFKHKTLSVKNIIEKIKLIYKEYGGRLQSNDRVHAKRSNYTLYYPDWPRPDWFDCPEWLNRYVEDEGVGGKDVIVVDEHTKWLKFHVWSVNGWFAKYYGGD